ncbi:MAG: hypothetical protein U0263_22815 [Polyangiaceae bacterium]
MKTVMVRYQVKADRVEENERYVRAVFSELEKEGTSGVRYATFKLADGVSFVHLAVIESDSGNPLAALASFREFTAKIGERCEVPPVSGEVEVIGAHRFFGG